jgi:hypothetical protein
MRLIQGKIFGLAVLWRVHAPRFGSIRWLTFCFLLPFAEVHTKNLVEICRGRVTAANADSLLASSADEETFLVRCVHDIGEGAVVRARLTSGEEITSTEGDLFKSKLYS